MLAAQAILPIFALIVLGYLLGWRQWLTTESAAGLANITFKLFMPTLLFAGSEDRPRLSDTERLAELIPGSRLAVIPGFDHATTVAASPEVLAVVKPFLSENG